MSGVFFALGQKVERHFHFAGLDGVEAAHKPVFAAAPRDGRVGADFGFEHLGLIPSHGEVCEKLELLVLAHLRRPVVPEQKLERTEKTDRLGQLTRV